MRMSYANDDKYVYNCKLGEIPDTFVSQFQKLSCDNSLLHTTKEKFENAALFLRLGLPSTLILHKRKLFRKRSSNWRNLKMPATRFRVAGKQVENVAF